MCHRYVEDVLRLNFLIHQLCTMRCSQHWGSGMKQHNSCCHGAGDVESKSIISYVTQGQVISAMKEGSTIEGD